MIEKWKKKRNTMTQNFLHGKPPTQFFINYMDVKKHKVKDLYSQIHYRKNSKQFYLADVIPRSYSPVPILNSTLAMQLLIEYTSILEKMQISLKT